MMKCTILIRATELPVMRKLLLVGILCSATLLTANFSYADLSPTALATQQTVMTELAKLEKNTNGKYIRSSKTQAVTLIAAAIQKNPELAASLTAYVIGQGVGLTAAVTAACKAAPEQASAITTAAIKAEPAAQAALITAAAVKSVPKQAAAITTAAILAVSSQAPAITSAAVTAAPSYASKVIEAALKAAESRETRRLVSVAASNAGVSSDAINKLLETITKKRDGSFEVFQKDTNNAPTSTITIGTSDNANNNAVGTTGFTGTVLGTSNGTGSTGGGGSICVKTSLTASCS
jgi:hypothetical protein